MSSSYLNHVNYNLQHNIDAAHYVIFWTGICSLDMEWLRVYFPSVLAEKTTQRHFSTYSVWHMFDLKNLYEKKSSFQAYAKWAGNNGLSHHCAGETFHMRRKVSPPQRSAVILGPGTPSLNVHNFTSFQLSFFFISKLLLWHCDTVLRGKI